MSRTKMYVYVFVSKTLLTTSRTIFYVFVYGSSATQNVVNIVILVFLDILLTSVKSPKAIRTIRSQGVDSSNMVDAHCTGFIPSCSNGFLR